MSEGEKISVLCGNCGTALKAPASAVGRTAKCPSCGHAVKIEAPALAPDPVPEPPVDAEQEAAVPPPVAEPEAAPDDTATESPPHAPTRRRTSAAERRQQREEAAAELNRPERLPIALGAAAGVAVVGAIAWSMIAGYTGYEFKYLAIAIGAGTGFAATRLGGLGLQVAISCAVLTALSVLVGRYMAIDITIQEEIAKSRPTEQEYRQIYDETKVDSRDYFALGLDPQNLSADDEETLAEFLVSHQYFDPPADSLGPADLEWFLDEHVARLDEFRSSGTSFEAWRRSIDEEIQANLDRIREEEGELTILMDSFKESPRVTVWILIGIAVAFASVHHESTQARRRAARASRETARES